MVIKIERDGSKKEFVFPLEIILLVVLLVVEVVKFVTWVVGPPPLLGDPLPKSSPAEQEAEAVEESKLVDPWQQEYELLIDKLQALRELDINGGMKREVIIEKWAFAQGVLYQLVQEGLKVIGEGYSHDRRDQDD